ncbi:MAG: DUF362 domain-containing protein [Oscillospiraceae bacterium]|nr:DUF362 domain-containing protein [Oscillospiraceae bacterium]
MNEVYLKKVAGYEDGAALRAAVAFIFDGCMFPRAKTGAEKVVVKVNLLRRAAPAEAVTTHPAVVAAVIAALKERGYGDVTVADCPSGPFTAARMKAIYETCGMTALEGDGVRLNYDFESVVKKPPRGGARGFEILKIIADADAVVNVGKLKTHALTGMTGAVKNLFGVVPGLTKTQLHFEYPRCADFCDMLCELAQTAAPALSILDAVVGMEGDGPSAGVPRAFGFVAGSCSPFDLDAAAARALGLGIRDAATVYAAGEKWLGPDDLTDASVFGDRDVVEYPLDDLKLPATRGRDVRAVVPGFLKGLPQRLFTRMAPRPAVDAKKCVGCGECARACPQKAIDIAGGRAHIRRQDCIRCFCCHEVCPQKAVVIRRSLLFRLFK